MLAREGGAVGAALDMRTRLRWLLLAVLVALLGSGAWLLKGELDTRRRAQNKILVDLLPDVAQRIRDFHRVKVENGKKVWEVSAREAQYLEGDGVVVVDAPVLEVNLRDQHVVKLSAERGKIYLRERELERVEFEGGIEAKLDDYELQTDQASYEAERGMIIAPGAVRIDGGGLDLQGEHMEIDVNAKKLIIFKDVRTILQPST